MLTSPTSRSSGLVQDCINPCSLKSMLPLSIIIRSKIGEILCRADISRDAVVALHKIGLSQSQILKLHAIKSSAKKSMEKLTRKVFMSIKERERLGMGNSE